MPELPDVEVYVDALRRVVAGHRLEGIRLRSPFLLRSVQPPLDAAIGKRIQTVERLGKRIVVGVSGDTFLVLHLMIAGRLKWRKAGAGIPGRLGLAAFDFRHGTLLLTEAGSKKRASLYVVAGCEGVRRHDPGGLEVLESSQGDFKERLLSANHTLKRALTDPRLFSGIGNAYSDEILHRAGLSPLRRTRQLKEDEIKCLFEACCFTLSCWTRKLLEAVGDGFPEKVTAFRPDMAVHGRYKKPCPRCREPIQRIVYAANQANYCARCQTGGKILADRALSRLLGQDWPRSLEELERLRRA